MNKWYIIVIFEVSHKISFLILQININFNNFTAIKVIKVNKQSTCLINMYSIISTIIFQFYFEQLFRLKISWYLIHIHAFINIQNKQVRWEDSNILWEDMIIIETGYFCEYGALIWWWLRDDVDFTHFFHTNKIWSRPSDGFIQSIRFSNIKPWNSR